MLCIDLQTFILIFGILSVERETRTGKNIFFIVSIFTTEANIDIPNKGVNL